LVASKTETEIEIVDDVLRQVMSISAAYKASVIESVKMYLTSAAGVDFFRSPHHLPRDGGGAYRYLEVCLDRLYPCAFHGRLDDDGGASCACDRVPYRHQPLSLLP
jgi:hypothetical protein